ncbi:MAG: cation-translocating P-type ATPase [Promethearchaeota archaeon]|nr:MAG: cation-translocating P-type ATPase [Candidatus Lokiarchaeota archaeon]
MSTLQGSGGIYYNQPISELLERFNTHPDYGLKFSELEERYLKYGYNELPKIKKSIWKIYLAPLFNFLIMILLITGIIIVILGRGDTQIITFTVVIINSITAVIQQFRAQKALESLREISALKATVLRDGKQSEIDTRDLVPGDIVILTQGDKVPADGRIIESMNLSVDEAPLTGESEPVEKNSNTSENKELSIQNQTNMVFMGTYVQTGRAKELITGTGTKTEIGKISQTLNEMGSIEDIPLTRKLNRLGKILGTIVIINLIILIIVKLTVLGIEDKLIQDEIVNAFTDSIIRAMNIVPINLPLLSTLVLITGVLNMAQSGVIIKNLSAIESLGRVSVIASDKTGTITKNEMTVEKFWINEQEYDVTGSGYDALGLIFKNTVPIDLNDNETFLKFLDSIIVNNNAKLEFEDIKVKLKDMKEKTVRRAIGSPTEAALLVLAEKTGLFPYDIKKKYEIKKEFSFSSELKRMTTICTTAEDKLNLFVFSKGAPERMLEISDQIEINGVLKDFDEKYKNQILAEINERANQGFRILAVVYKRLQKIDDLKREDAEKDLIFLGFVSIMDPPRLGVKESVKECQTGGIKVVMVTGDHPATAKTIASEMEIYKEGDLVALGNQVKDLTLSDFNKITVFARVEPRDKEIIVENYQKQNLICAMTGDGINDAPALKLANAGVAMGITGTDLAKETSDMVITDDNFSSIAQGVKIGRGIFAKIRTIIFFFICTNIMEGIIFFTFEMIESFIGFELFASNWQHIYIFGIMHSLPSLALVIDMHPKNVMNEPPRNEEELLNRNLWVLLLMQATLGGLSLFLALQLTLGGIIPLNPWNTNPSLSFIPIGSTTLVLTQMKARTMFITTIYIFEAFFIWTFRRPNKSAYKSITEELHKPLLFICLFALAIHILLVCFSFSINTVINDVLGLNLNFLFLSFDDWLICILFALPGIIGIEIFKFIARMRKIYF